METTQGVVCEWFVSHGFLHEALRQIDKNGSAVLCVVEDKSDTVKNGFVIYYKNRAARKPKRAGKEKAGESKTPKGGT